MKLAIKIGLICLILSAASAGHAQVLQTAALTEDPLFFQPDFIYPLSPDFIYLIYPEYNFRNFEGAPDLNNSGQITFIGSYDNPDLSSDQVGIFSTDPFPPSLIPPSFILPPFKLPLYIPLGLDRRAVESPSGSAYFTSLRDPSISFNSQVTFFDSPGSNSTLYRTTFSGFGNIETVARLGEHAPGTPSGTTFTTIRSRQTNNSGRSAFPGVVRGDFIDSTNNGGIWAEDSDTLRLIAQEGEPAPGLPSGVDFDEFFLPTALGPRINSVGQIAFTGSFRGNGIDSFNNRGIWSDRSGTLELLVQSGSQAAGAPSGYTFSSFRGFSFNSAGHVAFRPSLRRQNDSLPAYSGIWSDRSGAIAPVIQEGDQAPGLPNGVQFGNFFEEHPLPVFNSADQIAFLAELNGPGISASNNFSIWSEGSGSLEIVARTGDHAPGTPTDVEFSSFGVYDEFFLLPPSINSEGQVAFIASIRGPGVGYDSEYGLLDDYGIWAQDRSGKLQLIVRIGDTLEVRPDVFRTVSRLGFSLANTTAFHKGSSNDDGGRSGFNDLGQVAFGARFTDGSAGVFISNIATVPEPSTAILSGIMLLALGSRSIRRGYT